MSGKPTSKASGETVKRGKRGQLLPGSVLNPNGRPRKERCITESLRKYAEIETTAELVKLPLVAKAVAQTFRIFGTPETMADVLAQCIWFDALNGNDHARREILDRLEGKPTQTLDIPAAASFADYFAASAAERAAAKGER